MNATFAPSQSDRYGAKRGRRCKGSNVREIQVLGWQHASRRLRSGPNLGVVVPSQPLANRGVDVVPELDEVLDEDRRKIFVELETLYTGGALGTGRDSYRRCKRATER